MGWFSGIVVFLCLWWVALFAVLPWGIRADRDKDAQTGPGAPADPQIRKKFLVTTVVAAALWIVAYVMIEANLIDFREIAATMAEKDYN